MRTRIVNIISIALAFLIGGVFTYMIFGNVTTESGSSCGTTKCTNKVIIDDKGISEAVQKVYDAVVMIQNYQGNSVASTGTGFVYKVDEKYGYIMTNQHVVDGATKIIAIDSKDNEIEATYLGGDVYLDVAVIRIDKDKVLSVAEIGNSEEAKLGDTVFTVGSPLGYEYRGTVTGGRLSGKDRMVEVNISNSSNGDWMMKVLQTDAAINPGNSGGPLVNSNGQVIGINSMKLIQTEVEGMGFAIPIEYAMNHIETLEKGKTIVRPMLGIQLLDVTDTMALYQNQIMLDKNITEGVVVVSVVDKSGAKDAGFAKGDVITKVNGATVQNGAYLRYELYKYNVGDTVEITYLRNNKAHTVKVKLVASDS